MQPIRYHFISKCDELKLDVLEIYPISEPKGIIQFLHGMAEDKERYIEAMEFFSRHGYITLIHDHRGHGNSLRDKSDQGYFYDASGTYIVRDAHDITQMIKAKYPGLPVFLFGHSMGALVALNYLKYCGHDIQKLILCGLPGNNILCSFAISMVNIMEKIKGEYHRSKLIQKLSVGSYDKKFKGENKNCWLSADPENVRLYNASTNCGFTFTLNGFKNLFLLMKNAYDQNHWTITNPFLEILFIAGSQDPVIIDKELWRQTQIFLNQIGYKYVKAKMYHGMRHEILHEVRKEEVLQDILKFIEEEKRR